MLFTLSWERIQVCFLTRLILVVVCIIIFQLIGRCPRFHFRHFPNSLMNGGVLMFGIVEGTLRERESLNCSNEFYIMNQTNGHWSFLIKTSVISLPWFIVYSFNKSMRFFRIDHERWKFQLYLRPGYTSGSNESSYPVDIRNTVLVK